MSARTGRGSERTLLRTSVAIGVLTLVAVVAAGVLFATTRPERVAARTSVLVLPDSRIPQDEIAGYYETLNQGQVASTFAEILRSRFGIGEVEGFTEAEVVGATADVQVVPDTAVIEIEVTADQEALAVELANAITEQAIDYVRTLPNPYQLVSLDEADGAESADITLPTLIVVFVIVAVVAGLAAQQVVFQLGLVLARRRELRRDPSE